MKANDKDDLIFMIAIAFFIASLIRVQFIPVFGFFVGFMIARLDSREKWVKLK